ncbi:MAG: hypothetical protein OHK0039_20460 [Bacteroidia bacterium]
MFSGIFSQAQTLYSEDFDDATLAGKGVSGPQPATLNMSGVTNFSIVGDFTGLSASDDYLRVVGGVLEAKDAESEVCFLSTVIDISGVGSASFSVSIVEDGDHEPTDYVDVILIVDGNEQLIANWNNRGSATHTLVGDIPDDGDFLSEVVTANGITGSTLQIKICVVNNAASELFRIDNVLVEGQGGGGGGDPSPVVVINEIHYNGLEAGTDTTEFIELYNAGTVAADLSGWVLSGLEFTFPSGTTLPAGAYLVIAVDADAFTNYYGCAADFDAAGALSNSGETVSLSDASNTLIDAVTFDDCCGWATAADGNGPSLELLDANTDNSLPASWAASLIEGGTPGKANQGMLTRCTIIDIVINEIQYNPDDSQGFVDDDYEFVELYNNSTVAVDLAGWQFTDGEGTYTFPASSVIAAGEYIVVAKNAATYAGNGYQVFTWAPLTTLSNSGDDITLKMPDGTVHDVVNYDDGGAWPTAADGDGPSLELIDPTLDNSLAASWEASAATNGTPGAANSSFSGFGCDLVIELGEPACESLTSGPANDTYTVTISFTGGGADVYSIVPNSGSLSAASDNPDTDATGLLIIEGIAEGTDLGFSITSTGGCNITVSAVAPFCTPPSPVVINELNYNPIEAGTDTTEFIELYNTSASAVDLSGWNFSSGVVFTFPAGASIAANGYLVIAGNATTFENRYGCAPDYQWTSGSLNNGGEIVTLLSDNFGTPADIVSYDNAAPWPTAANGAGPSLELIDASSDNNDAANWAASLIDGGTPGAANQGTTTGCIVIPSITFKYKNSENGPEAPDNATIKPQLRLQNDEATALNLADFMIRYWITLDGATSTDLFCQTSDAGCGNTATQLVTLAAPRTGADAYIELAFTGGTINPGQRINTKLIATRLDGNFSESNDYSYIGIITNHVDNFGVTVYYKGVLIYGTEPADANIRDWRATSLPAPKAYPNPFNEGMVIALENNVAVAQYRLIDMTGRVVYRGETDGTEFRIKAPELAPGVYVLEVVRGSLRETLRVVKAK